MDRDTMNKLRLDRRLIRRRGWIDEAALDQELESLPDVSDKAAPVDAPLDAPGSGAEQPSESGA